MALFSKKKAAPAADAPPPITLSAKGAADSQQDQINLLTAKQSPGFIVAQRILAHALDNRAESIILDYTAQGVAVLYSIDGFRVNSPPIDRQTGDVMLAVLKVITALNMNERRAKQKGKFGAEYRRRKWTVNFTSQGTPTGERVLLQFDDGRLVAEKLADTGMRDKMEEELRRLLREPKGLLLFSAPPGQGFTTTFNAALRSSDRYIKNWVEVSDLDKKDPEVENVPITTYDSAAGETPMSVLPKLIRTYPDVVAIRDLVDAATATLMCEQVTEEGRLVLAGIRGKDAVEALLRVLMLKVPPALFAPVVVCSLNQRLVRKLCDDCKQPYPPTPQVLQQLGIPAGKVQAFFRHHEGPLPLPPDAPKNAVPQVCHTCGGIGFKGRSAVFELLVMNDQLRETLMKTPKIDVLRAEARKAGFRSMQEEGIALVAKGVTELPELLRVLKE